MLLTWRAVHPAWGFGAGVLTKSFGSNGILLGWRSNLPYLKLWGRNTFKRTGIGLGWPPRCLQETRLLLVELVTWGVSGCLLLPKGKALCSCRGCSSNLELVGEGRAAGHGLMASFFFF